MLRAVEIPCSTWSHFIQDKLKISIFLSLDKCKICIKLIWTKLFTRELISAWFHTVLESVNCLSTERYKLNLYCRTSKIFFGQVHYGHLLVPGQVENFTISTPLPMLLLKK